jgi:hypothetical protein
MGMVARSPPVTRASTALLISAGSRFEVQSDLLRNFTAALPRQASQDFSASLSSSSSSFVNSPESSQPAEKHRRAKSVELRQPKEGEEEEDSDADQAQVLLQPFDLEEGLHVDEGVHYDLMGFIEKDVLNRNSLCFLTLFSAFGSLEKFDPVFHKIEPSHMAVILARLRALPKDWARGKVAKTTYQSTVENLAYRLQLSLRSIQEEMLGLFHAMEKGDVHLAMQLVLDTYALATQASTDCHEARLASGVPALSRALQPTNHNALVTPGVQARMDELGVDEGVSNSFFPRGGRGARPFFSQRFRGRGYGRGRGGRGYSNYQYPQRQSWSFPQQYQQQNQQAPFTSVWRNANRGRAYTPPPGRGYRGRGR